MGTPIEFMPYGGMNKDLDYQHLNRGQYPDALNIRPITNQGATGGDQEIIRGNLFSAALGEVIEQDKTYRVYINTLAPATTWQFNFYDQNGDLIFTVSRNVAANNFATYTTLILGDIIAAIPATWGFNLTDWPTAINEGYYDISLNLIPYSGIEWTLETLQTDVTPDVEATQVITAEAIDLSMTGYYWPIFGYDLLGDIFVWATPCHLLPSTYDITMTADDGFGGIRITTATPHGFTAARNGEVVVVSQAGNTSANGTWIGEYVSATQLDLHGSVWGGVAALTGTLTLNSKGYGTIASMVYDRNNDVWTAKKLIRSSELNFRDLKQPEGEVHKQISQNGVSQWSFYWTDDFNPPRVMYYKGSFQDDGAIAILNLAVETGDVGLYDFGTIGKELRLFLNGNSSRTEVTGTTQFGGAAKAGNLRFTHRLSTELNSPTPLQLLTNPINLYSAEETASNNKFILGNRENSTTPKRVQIQVSGLQPGLFKYVELIMIQQIGPESFVPWFISRTEITGDTMDLEYSGLEQGAYVMANEELLVETEQIATARHLKTLDNILILGDYTVEEEIDFTEVSTQIWHRLKKEEISMIGFADDLGPAREYQSTMNVLNKVGYMYNETDRFGVRWTLRGSGGKTKISFLDDIRFDVNPINIVTSANAPYGNRRGIRIKNITYIIDAPVLGSSYLFVEIDDDFDHGFIAGDVITISDTLGLAPPVNVNTTHTIDAILGPIVQIRLVVPVLIGGSYVPYSGRINGGLSTADITTDTNNPLVNGSVYVIHPEFSNIPWDYVMADGRKVRDVVESAEIVRVPNIPEVMFTGILLPGQLKLDLTTYSPQTQFSDGIAGGLGVYTPALGNQRRQIGFIYSPDLALNPLLRTEFSPGDYIVLFGPTANGAWYTESPAIGAGFDNYFEFNGASALNTTPKIVVLEAGINVSRGDGGSITGATFGTAPYSLIAEEAFGAASWAFDMQMVVLADSGAPAPATDGYFEDTLNDTGVFIIQYFRPRPDKYGAIDEGFYQGTGHFITPPLSQGPIINNQDVFGGYVFNQKTYHKIMYKEDPADFKGTGWSTYLQNRSNTQMRWHDITDPGMLFPPYIGGSTSTWLRRLYSEPIDQFRYYTGYSIYNLLNQLPAYDADLVKLTDFPASVIWTPVKVINSLVDAWRINLPLDRKDFDLSKGNLNNLYVLNGELYMHQDIAFSRLFFNSRGMLQTLDSEEIILGSGEVLSRNGQVLSTIGCSSKWAFVKGQSQGGNDVLYWINVEHGKMLRFGADGTRSIADLHGMESWFANNTDWLHKKDTPAAKYGEGIHGVWNGRFGEVIFFLHGKRGTDAWVAGTNYEIGDRVHLAVQPHTTNATFSQFGEIYVAITNHVAVAGGAGNEPETGATWATNWVKVSHTDPDYFNEYTIVFSEKRNSFTCEISPQPYIAWKWLKDYQSPSPALLTAESADSAQDRIFTHNRGNYCEWYKSGAKATAGPMTHNTGNRNLTGTGFLTYFFNPSVYTYIIPIDGVDYYVSAVLSDNTLQLTEPVTAAFGTSTAFYIALSRDAYITMVVNQERNLTKHYEWLQMNTYIAPYQMEFETLQHRSDLIESDFEYLENYYYSPIKNDTIPTGLNADNTDDLFGPWLAATLIMERYVYQNLKNFIVTVLEYIPNPLIKK